VRPSGIPRLSDPFLVEFCIHIVDKKKAGNRYATNYTGKSPLSPIIQCLRCCRNSRKRAFPAIKKDGQVVSVRADERMSGGQFGRKPKLHLSAIKTS